MNLAANIARLRRDRGMTQEALAEMIGVSPQTISKWENTATYPDVALLPVLADLFGVSIDALYGREKGGQTATPEQAIDRVIESAREAFTAACYDPETDGRFEDQLAQYKKVMQLDDHHRSLIESDRDVLYFREKLGVMALRRPQEGWNTLFADEKAAALLQVLADGDFRRAMRVILQKRMWSFTLPSLMKAAGIVDEQNLARCLTESGQFARRELQIDEKPLIYYEMTMAEQHLHLLYAILAFACERANYQGVHYCFFGNSQFYAP